MRDDDDNAQPGHAEADVSDVSTRDEIWGLRLGQT